MKKGIASRWFAIFLVIWSNGQVTQRMVHLKRYVTSCASCVTHSPNGDTMIRSRLPLVSGNNLFRLDEMGKQQVPIVVGSDAWYGWLADQQLQSFSFQCQSGTCTIRRERKRHGWYWYAYRKRAGKLHKAYLGKSEEVTLERLNVVASVLSGQDNNDQISQAHSDMLNESTRQVSSDSINEKDRPFLTSTSPLMYLTGSGQATQHNLPSQFTPLIGREQEVAAVGALLRQPEVRLLTLTGTGGVGKTRLGLQIATEIVKDFVDGVYFVSLAPISDPELVVPTIAQTFSLSEVGDQSFLERLTASLQAKRLLLLLDNFEQVIRAAPVLTELLEKCSTLKILVTSREILRVRGEQEFFVAPLALPDLSYLPEPEAISQYAAVALFLQRARFVRSDFQITLANATPIATICTHLDGLPLALELAAARVKLLSPQALLARLEHRFAVLTQGPRDVHTRQQTLRNTLQWSYNLLNTEEQRLFRSLAVFVDGYTLEAVEAVCIMPGEETQNVFEGIASLLDKSLIQQHSSEDGEQRLSMLETIREYGLEGLAASGELALIRQAHANYYLALAEEAGSELDGSRQGVWLERLEREHDNMRAAMHWSLEQGEAGQDVAREMALRFGGALRGFWVIRGHHSEGRAFLEQVLMVSEGIVTTVRAKALQVAAALAVYQMDHARGESLCRECLLQCQERGDLVGSADALHLLGTIFWQRGDFAVARSLMEESLALGRKIGNKEKIASSLYTLGELDTQQGAYVRASALLEESLALYREVGDARDVAILLRALALLLFVSQSDPTKVRKLLDESLVLSRKLSDKPDIARCLSHAALVALQQGDAVTACVLAKESITLHRETGDQWGIAWLLFILARVDMCQGEYAAALTLYEESLTIARKIASKLIVAFCLEGLASLAGSRGMAVRAARLWGAAEALRKTMGAPIWPVERACHEQAVSSVRVLIGEKVFVAAWHEGKTMSLEQILTAQESVMVPPPSAQFSTSSPSGLTNREIDVLRLLAMGLTSTQIAGELVISLPTVNTHVRSIYTKLNVTSRSGATRYAVEHHLV
jgi:predicted ATPase/DNA-binding CsgD family transcriptional regulator